MIHFSHKKIAPSLRSPHTFESTHFSIVRLFTMLSAVLVIILFVYVGWFLYKRVYQSIGTVQTLLVIQADPTLEPISFHLYDDVINTWQKRLQTTTSTQNPFISHTLLESQ